MQSHFKLTEFIMTQALDTVTIFSFWKKKENNP